MPGYGASDGFVRENPPSNIMPMRCLPRWTPSAIQGAHRRPVGRRLIGASYAAEYPDQTLSYTFCQGLTGLAGLPDDERTKQRRLGETLRELG